MRPSEVRWGGTGQAEARGARRGVSAGPWQEGSSGQGSKKSGGGHLQQEEREKVAEAGANRLDGGEVLEVEDV